MASSSRLSPTGALAVGGVGGIAVCLLAAVAGIFIQLQCSKVTPCMCHPAGADVKERCQLIHLYMKVPLIAVHIIPFILMPVTMWVFQANGHRLVEMGAMSPVQSVCGLAYIMVSIGGEVGWHVHQQWFYHEDYDILNYFFYAFNTLGPTFWALGVQTKATQSRLLDGLLLLCTPLATLVYAYSAYAHVTKMPDYMPAASKVPIYIVMSYQYILLSWRLFKLLKDDARVWLFPFFSIGVNLFFVFLLTKYETHQNLNPLFHILHDAAGTEMGILIITFLVWRSTQDTPTKKTS